MKPGKKALLWILILLVLAGGVAAFFYFKPLATSSLNPKKQIPPSIALKAFQGENPPFDFTFEYPDAWKLKAHTFKDQLDIVQLLGPQDPVTRTIPGISFKIQKASGEATPASIAASFTKREGKIRGFNQLYNGAVTLGGIEGSRLEFQYVMPLPFRSKNAKPTLMKRQECFVKKGDKIYQISLFMTEEQFKIYQPVFDRVVESFKFLD